MRRREGRLCLLSVYFLTLTLAVPGFARVKTLAEIKNLDPNDLKVQGFVLKADQKVDIHALGFDQKGKRHRLSLGNAWILDETTREVVWELKRASTKRVSKTLREFEGKVELPAGQYEVYYATFPAYGGDGWEGRGFGDLLSELVDRIAEGDYDEDDYKDVYRDFKIVVRGDGEKLSERGVRDRHERMNEDAILSSTSLGRNHYEHKELVLERPMKLQVYAIGEVRREGQYDFSWIIDTKTRKKVWALTYWDSDHAGGGKKNRIMSEKLSLPAGSYAVFCVTDDSHGPDDWNAPPPYDPMYWGLTIRAVKPEEKRYAAVRDYENIGKKNVILQFAGLGDKAFESGGFTLEEPMDLRIYAVGEGRDDEMYDYSWIVDADTREVVWEMKHRRTEHAGGAGKNRLFDDVVHFNRGNYIAYVVTDGSHSYRNWNASPPHDQKHWGLTVLLADDDQNRGAVTAYEEKEDAAILTRIVGVGDNERRRERFKLEKAGLVRVYAIGEGTGGEMYDYAWIEDAGTGKVVWEMTYRMTDHAGGAKKNRMYNSTVHLEAGEYIVHYRSDGSHSFHGWNARPPADVVHWGVTVKKAGEK